MTFALGLTGSIGMGKSTTAALFADAGCAVWDADAAVHRLYAAGGAAVAPLTARFPAAARDGGVSRDALREILAERLEALSEIEAIVHPLVRSDRAAFQAQTETDIAIFDIPLLYETGAESEMDAVACVDVAPDIQRSRVLARPGMTEDDFAHLLSKQMPNPEKCARAEFIIRTDDLETARHDVQTVLNTIRKRL